jgi:UDP-N-acetylglucosamine diphosphorylase/glucosamine-1-phosphate N-acetyltransferase
LYVIDMNTPTLTIYDDGRGGFGPMTSLRAIFQARTGALQTKDRIERVVGLTASALWVPQRLCEVVGEAYPGVSVNPKALGTGSSLLINGRWAGSCFIEQVGALSTGEAVVQSDGQVVAVSLDARGAIEFIQSGYSALPDHVTTLRVRERVLIERPWHVLDDLPVNLRADLAGSDALLFQADHHPQVTVFGGHPVGVGTDVRLMPTVVIDAEQGPVLIGHGAVVHPYVVLQGPCYIGPGATLMPHACIRPNTVIGPSCKVGGEVSASIMQGHSNKAHAGYLGDSLVGSWVNMGAGTITSNLKNTYGPVRVQLHEDQSVEDTGRTHHGAIIGDYVCIGIGTRLPTGAVIHPGCMLAGQGWAPKFAGPLGFYTASGRQPYDLDKLMKTLRTMTERRGVKLTDQEVSLIKSLR